MNESIRFVANEIVGYKLLKFVNEAPVKSSKEFRLFFSSKESDVFRILKGMYYCFTVFLLLLVASSLWQTMTFEKGDESERISEKCERSFFFWILLKKQMAQRKKNKKNASFWCMHRQSAGYLLSQQKQANDLRFNMV